MLWRGVKKGLFITFEGIDGCGKSTQLELAQRHLETKKVDLLVTREPGGTSIGEKIRELLLSPGNREMSDVCELMLYFAARAQHVSEKIRPAIDRGLVVLCDRFSDATFAYQGFGRRVPMDSLIKFDDFINRGLVPSLTFIFDVSVDCAYKRLKAMNKAPDRLEGGSREFYQRVRDGYVSLAADNPDRIMLLDGGRSVDDLSSAVCGSIDRHLGNRGQMDVKSNQ